jgi:hypothetical protein
MHPARDLGQGSTAPEPDKIAGVPIINQKNAVPLPNFFERELKYGFFLTFFAKF